MSETLRFKSGPLVARWAVVAAVLYGLLAGSAFFSERAETLPTPTVFDDPVLVQHYQEMITAENLSSLLHEFASDELEGRETGTAGQHRAAGWLAQTYINLGIAPSTARSPGPRPHTQDFMQTVPIYGRELQQATLTARTAAGTLVSYRYVPREPVERLYLANGTVPEISGDVEFRSYDMANASLDYQEYAALQPIPVEKPARWVMMFAPDGLIQPAERHGAHRSTSIWPRLHLKTDVDPGAALPLGYLLIATDEHVRTTGARVAQQALSIGALSLTEPISKYPFPPVYVLTPDAADTLLNGSGLSVDVLRTRIAEGTGPLREAVSGLSVGSKIDFPIRLFDAANVVGWIAGMDPVLRDEFVVLSSHYDHIGTNPLLEGDNVYNGADDNGSGTVAMLEIARAFQRAKSDGLGPRRSIVFAHFTGEEKGLLGSKYYADTNPLFPLTRTVTNINIDMIGRLDPSHPEGSDNYVYIIGSRLISEELHDINDRVNRLTGVDVDLDERFNSKNDPNRFYRRSDHWNFGKHGIPFIFFFTGTHEDYHRPEDEADKIEYDRLARIARLIFATTWQVANQDQPPELSGDGFN